jgi:eukaryotic-like serine/threonine-protein kinase
MSAADPTPHPDARWARLRPVFDATAELPPAEREPLIQAAALAAEALTELRSLLAHHDEAAPSSGFMAQAAAQAMAEPAEPASWVGHRLGNWEVVRALGSGGMGEVFEARRADGQYQGRAAVKLMKGGTDNAAVWQRFAQERQALAQLDHPHIARLLDAGLSDEGLPYFVLEYVDGQAIDRAVQPLALPARLRLFLQLADAVAHAHRQLLVHRDLKPGNVMVDAQGQVKLLDFGIAKALEPGSLGAGTEARAETSAGAGSATDAVAAPRGIDTQTGHRPYTPHYASPEQVRGEAVGTGTDIYSLGVLLFELLTGQRPTGRGATTPAEVARAVVEEAPERPSRVAPVRRLEGDLDAIVLKALDKSTAARYASVEALAADVRAWLETRPVSARAATPAYVWSRFVRRHKVPVAAAALGLAGLLTGLVVSVVQMRASEAARDLAERRLQQVRQLAGKLVFEHHDRIAALPGAVNVRAALLADGAGVMDALLAEGPPDARLAREAAETYFRIATLQGEQLSPSQDRLDEAWASLGKALALQASYVPAATAAAPADPLLLPRAADMWLARSGMQARRALLSDAAQSLERARQLAEQALALRADDAQAISRLASVEGRLAEVVGGSHGSANLGRVGQARVHADRAVALLEGLVAREPARSQWKHELGWAMNKRFLIAMLEGRTADALAAADRGMVLADAAAQAEPSSVHLRYQAAVQRMGKARAWLQAGEYARALALQDEAIRSFRDAAAADAGNRTAGRYLLLAGMSRGQALVQAGRSAEARPLLTEAVTAMGPAAAGDADGERLRAEVLVWAARAWREADAPRALGYARGAEALLGVDRGNGNAAWRWTLAQAQGEAAAALAAQGLVGEARRVAMQALATWGADVPALFSAWVQRDRALAR